MSEYIKRELAISCIALETDMSLEQARKILGNVPSIDVIFCKDCKYYEYCNHWAYDVGIDDYCSYGERKEQEDG